MVSKTLRKIQDIECYMLAKTLILGEVGKAIKINLV